VGFGQSSRVVVAPDGVASINGRKVFSIGLTVPPAPEAKAPSGKAALKEFHDAGVTFIRTGPMWDYEKQRPLEWDDQWLKVEHRYMDAAARNGRVLHADAETAFDRAAGRCGARGEAAERDSRISGASGSGRLERLGRTRVGQEERRFGGAGVTDNQ
jgi:hypothetical protein